jgi:hypothetical protein
MRLAHAAEQSRLATPHPLLAVDGERLLVVVERAPRVAEMCIDHADAVERFGDVDRVVDGAADLERAPVEVESLLRLADGVV